MPRGLRVSDQIIQKILDLRHNDGLSVKAIGARLKMNHGHVSKILKREAKPKTPKPMGRPKKTSDRLIHLKI